MKIKATGSNAELTAFKQHNAAYITDESKSYDTGKKDIYRRYFTLKITIKVSAKP